jgi:hypothetical protein
MYITENIDILDIIKQMRVDLTEIEVKIIIALSDNKGYSLTELAEIVGSYDTYLCNKLNGLSSEKFGNFMDSYSIQYHHIIDPSSLFQLIQDKNNPISKYIFNKINIILEDFAAKDTFMEMASLSMGLNNILSDQNLYNRERFAGIKLSNDAIKLINMRANLKGEKIRILNRILLEDAYPNEICRTRFSLIHQSFRKKTEGSKNPYYLNSDLRTFKFITEFLVDAIKKDRYKILEMKTRLESYMRGFGGFDKLFPEDAVNDVERLIKDDDRDLTFYKTRYKKNIDDLWKFMTSNYVGEQTKKYGGTSISINGLERNEFDSIKYEFKIDIDSLLTKLKNL